MCELEIDESGFEGGAMGLLDFLPALAQRLQSPSLKPLFDNTPLAQDLHRFYLEVLGVDSSTMREINRTHRGKDSTTDVLSFPLVYDFSDMSAPIDTPLEKNAQDSHALNFHSSAESKLCLGSIILNLELAKEQAKKLGHSLQDELSLYFIHALLHILGFDHEVDNGEQRAMECQIINILELPCSLIERAHKVVL